mgnify:CR=1 FL=1
MKNKTLTVLATLGLLVAAAPKAEAQYYVGPRFAPIYAPVPVVVPPPPPPPVIVRPVIDRPRVIAPVVSVPLPAPYPYYDYGYGIVPPPPPPPRFYRGCPPPPPPRFHHRYPMYRGGRCR